MAPNLIYRGRGETPQVVSRRVSGALLPGVFVRIVGDAFELVPSGYPGPVYLLINQPYSGQGLSEPYFADEFGSAFEVESNEPFQVRCAAGTYSRGQTLAIGNDGLLRVAAEGDVVRAFFSETSGERMSDFLADVVIATGYTVPSTGPTFDVTSFDVGTGELAFSTSVEGTLYWVADTEPTITLDSLLNPESGDPEIPDYGVARGNFAVTPGEAVGTLTYQELAFNTYYLHAVVQPASDGDLTPIRVRTFVVEPASGTYSSNFFIGGNLNYTANLNGTAYYLIDTNTTRTPAQIKAGGELLSGSFVPDVGSTSVVIDISGLAPGAYHIHDVAQEAGTGDYVGAKSRAFSIAEPVGARAYDAGGGRVLFPLDEEEELPEWTTTLVMQYEVDNDAGNWRVAEKTVSGNIDFRFHQSDPLVDHTGTNAFRIRWVADGVAQTPGPWVTVTVTNEPLPVAQTLDLGPSDRTVTFDAPYPYIRGTDEQLYIVSATPVAVSSANPATTGTGSARRHGMTLKTRHRAQTLDGREGGSYGAGIAMGVDYTPGDPLEPGDTLFLALSQPEHTIGGNDNPDTDHTNDIKRHYKITVISERIPPGCTTPTPMIQVRRPVLAPVQIDINRVGTVNWNNSPTDAQALSWWEKVLRYPSIPIGPASNESRQLFPRESAQYYHAGIVQDLNAACVLVLSGSLSDETRHTIAMSLVQRCLEIAGTCASAAIHATHNPYIYESVMAFAGALCGLTEMRGIGWYRLTDYGDYNCDLASPGLDVRPNNNVPAKISTWAGVAANQGVHRKINTAADPMYAPGVQVWGALVNGRTVTYDGPDVIDWNYWGLTKVGNQVTIPPGHFRNGVHTAYSGGAGANSGDIHMVDPTFSARKANSWPLYNENSHFHNLWHNPGSNSDGWGVAVSGSQSLSPSKVDSYVGQHSVQAAMQAIHQHLADLRPYQRLGQRFFDYARTWAEFPVEWYVALGNPGNVYSSGQKYQMLTSRSGRTYPGNSEPVISAWLQGAEWVSKFTGAAALSRVRNGPGRIDPDMFEWEDNGDSQSITLTMNRFPFDGWCPIVDIEISTDDGVSWAALGIDTVGGGATLSGLTGGQNYPNTRLRAIDFEGREGTPSAPFNVVSAAAVNLINEFGTWQTPTGGTIVENGTGPTGLTAWNFGDWSYGIRFHHSASIPGQNILATFSFYVKYVSGSRWVLIESESLGASNVIRGQCWFNSQTGVLGSFNGAVVSRSMASVGGGWFRCEMVCEFGGDVGSGAGSGHVRLSMKASNGLDGSSNSGKATFSAAQVIGS